MPKTATRQKPSAKAGKTSSNGTGEKPDTAIKDREVPEWEDIEQAKREYGKRKASQLEAIKKTDKINSIHSMFIRENFLDNKNDEIWKKITNNIQTEN